MAIGASIVSSSLTGYTPGQGGANQASGNSIPVGLRGAVSLGSGLRTGVTVVERAIQTSAELQDARERAREALQEQLELERKAAEAEQAVRRQQAQSPGPSDDTSATTTAAAPQDDTAGTQTIDAAVAAGQAGRDAPRGAFVDFSV